MFIVLLDICYIAADSEPSPEGEGTRLRRCKLKLEEVGDGCFGRGGMYLCGGRAGRATGKKCIILRFCDKCALTFLNFHHIIRML